MESQKRRRADIQNRDSNSDSPPPSSAAITSLSPQYIRNILQPFPHYHLLDLLQAAALRHPDVLDAIRSVANRDTTLRKLFVRGLGGETTTGTLQGVFSAFGPIEDSVVIFDKSTGRSKGYGFVTFKHIDGAVLAVKEPSKIIDGRMTVTQLASAGVSNNEGDVWRRKIFVGNVPFEISSETLLNHFQMYGEVEEGPLGFDKGCGKAKGFAFFAYKTEESAKASLREPIKMIDGYQVHCKLAVVNKKEKPATAALAGDGMSFQQQQQQPQYGGFGGGLQGHASLPGINLGTPSFGDYGGRFPPPNSAGMPAGGFLYQHPMHMPLPLPNPRLAPQGMFQGRPPFV